MLEDQGRDRNLMYGQHELIYMIIAEAEILLAVKTLFQMLWSGHPISCLAVTFTTRWVNSSKRRRL